jgi:hypothetical protein
MNRAHIITLSTIAALALAMLPSAAVSQQASLKQQLVGAWTLVSIIATDKAGNKSDRRGRTRRGFSSSTLVAGSRY